MITTDTLDIRDDDAACPARLAEEVVWTNLRSEAGRRLLADALVAALAKQPANREALDRWIQVSGNDDVRHRRSKPAQSDAPSTKVKSIEAQRRKLTGQLGQADVAERKAARAHATATKAREEIEIGLAHLDANEATVLEDAFLKAIEQRLLPASALGSAFSMMRIVSGYFQMNAEWEATLPPKHKEAVLLRREERPRKSAEMMAILDALAGDPLFELQMFGDVYELLTKHGEAAKKRGTVRTGSAYRTHLNPAARSDDIADVVSGIPGRTGAASE